MRRYLSMAVWVLLPWLASGPAGAQPRGERLQSGVPEETTSPAPAEYRALLDQYCVTCHNQRLQTAGLTLDTMDLTRVGDAAEIWEEAVMKLRGGMMPPPGARQPDPDAVDSLVDWLEGSLDRAAHAHPNPGYVALHRLNRAEYQNAIRELFGVEVNAEELLPIDDISEGFSNIANVLKVSPSFLEQYITAARVVAAQAVGEPPPSEPARMTLSGGSEPDPYVSEGLPLGTQGTFTDHFFPADAEYEFTIPSTSSLILDGVKYAAPPGDVAPLPPEAGGNGGRGGRGRGAGFVRNGTIRVSLAAGTHTVAVVSPATAAIESDTLLQSFVPGAGGGSGGRGRNNRGGDAAEVTGPYNPTGPILDTPRRQQLFICRPPAEATEDEALGCAHRILSRVAREAFRRPVTERDLIAPLSFFGEGRRVGDFEVGIQYGLSAILASPKFLYRTEAVPADLAPGSVYRIGDLELASRLSFFLWSQNPDETLLDLAMDGRLREPEILEGQVQRMLADPRSRALVTNFAFQWLNLGTIDDITPDAILFPNFNQDLQNAFVREIELFIQSIIEEDRSVVDLLGADYTFVNERLAAHYGIPDIRGDRFQRITLADENRWGLLGKGGVLMVTSYPNRTAPVIRGAWIMERLLGTPPPVPPPDVEAFPENQEGEQARTVRERLEAHRANPTCNACHGVMDPLGFALENFDAIGEWRTMDRWARTPIDASGQLVDGSPVNNPSDLRRALTADPEQFVQAMTKKLLMYALGRTVEYYDMPVVRQIVHDSEANGYAVSSIVMGIVNSAPFQTKRVPEEADVAALD